MSIRIAKRIAVVAACGTALVATAPAQASTPAPDDTIKVIDGVRTDAPVETAEELEDFIVSSTPKVVTQDVASGEFTEVYVQPKSDGINKIGMRNPCGSGDLCVQANPPYTNNGFYNSGTKTGTWPGKVKWTTGRWTGRTRVGSVWGGYLGPNSTGIYDKVATVTGVQIK